MGELDVISRTLKNMIDNGYKEGFSECAYWVANNLDLTQEQYDLLNIKLEEECGDGFCTD